MNQIYSKRSGRERFYTLLLLLLGLIFIRYSLQIDLSRAFFLAIVVLIACLGDRDEVIAMCVCCIPLHESLDLFYAEVLCIAVYLVKFWREIRLSQAILPILVMILWELLHCFGQPFSPVGFITDCVPLLLLAVVMCGSKKYDYDFIARAYALTATGACIILLFRLIYLADFNIAEAFTNLQRLGVDSMEVADNLSITGGTPNANSLGILCVLGITGLLQLRTAGRGKTGDWVIVVILLVFGTLTSSKTYLVCLVIMAVLLLFSQQGSLKRKARFMAAGVTLLLLALLIMYLIFPDALAYYYSRFQADDLTTGRLDLMKQYHAFIVSEWKNAFFGVGLQDFSEKVVSRYMVAWNVPHNGIQELLMAWGIPGLVMFCALLYMMLWRSGHFCRKQGLINYIPLLILIAKAQAGQLLASAYTMLAFSFAYLSLCAELLPARRTTVPADQVYYPCVPKTKPGTRA